MFIIPIFKIFFVFLPIQFLTLMLRPLFMLLSLLPLTLMAQKITVEQYIETYKDIAMREMLEHKIPASITLAQGILESGAGNSTLAREAKNHFGIKCHKGWTGKTMTMDDDAKNECFRKYDSAEESYVDHSLFLTTRNRYAGLFELDIMDYEGWAKGLKAAGYATNSRYAQLLIDRIVLYGLDKYDRIAMGLEVEEEKSDEVLEEYIEDDFLELAYSPVDRSVFELVDMTEEKRFIYENNKVRFVFAKEGESPERLAAIFDIRLDKFCKYNLIKHPEEMVFHSGDVVYLEALRKRNWKAKSHIVAEGETIRDIALHYAVRPEKILKKNKLKTGTRLYTGQKLTLR